jgi:hypothetical protein
MRPRSRHPHRSPPTFSTSQGAALLLSGIIFSILTSPILDRLSSTRPYLFSLLARCIVPPLSLTWFSLIWAVRANNAPALYAICVLIGIGSLVMLPVGLELAVEVSRNAEGSAAAMWFSGNLWGIVFVLGSSLLPPLCSFAPNVDLLTSPLLCTPCFAQLRLLFAHRHQPLRQSISIGT